MNRIDGMMGGVRAVAVRVGFARPPRLSRAVRGAVIACMALVVACGPASPRYSAAEHRRVEKVVAELAPVLERYRQEHGEYPPTLQAAGIPTPQTLYGPLRYRSGREYDGLPIYEVSFGDYDRNGFAASYSSLNGHEGEWHLDM
jgi:hypothetical protein